MSTPFPLLSAPHLVITEIVRSADLPSLVCLSLCSRTTHYVVKANISRDTVDKLELVGDHLSAYLRTKTSSFRVLGAASREDAPDGLSVVVINEQTVTVAWNTEVGCLQTFWSDEKEGFRQIGIYLANLFEKALRKKYRYVVRKTSFWMIDWMQDQLNSSYSALVPGDEELNSEDYLYILNKCTAKALYLNARPTEEISHLDSFIPRDILRINHGLWFRLEHLIKLECQEIRIANSYFTGKRCNFILKHWLGGGFKCLKFLQLDTMGPLDEEMITNGLHAKLVPVDYARTFHGTNGSWVRLPANNYDLQREDGKIASFRYYNQIFFMAVWPDMRGNLP